MSRGGWGLLSAPSFAWLHLAQGSRLFWSLRYRAKRAAFFVNRLAWRFAHLRRSVGGQLSLAGSIARATVTPIVFSLLAVGAAYYADNVLVPAHPWAQRWLPFEPAHEDFLSVATTLAGVAGTFLGLYFTAVSVVASTAYSDVPDDVRMAALTEKVGTLYVDAVAQLCAVSLLLSICLTAGLELGSVTLILLAMSGLAGIFSFVPLGVRAFLFLNPVKLAQSAGQDVLDSATQAGSKRYYRDDPSFQNAYGRRARTAMDTLDHIVKIVIKEPHNDAATVRGLAHYLLRLFSHYATIKVTIPIESLWFARKPSFRSWLTASGTQLQMALETETQIPPEQIADATWLELRVSDSLHVLLSELLRQKEYESVDSCTQVILAHSEELTRSHRFEEARILARLLARLAPPAETDAASHLPRRQTLDLLRRGTIGQSIGLARLMERDLKAEVFAWTEAVERQDGGASAPASVAGQLEFLRRSINFELGSGARVTPDWFLKHVIAGSYLKELLQVVATLVEDVRHDLIDRAVDATRSTSRDAVPLIQLGLEACNKAATHIASVASAVEQLSAFRRPIGEHEWVESDFQQHIQAIGAMRKELTQSLARATFQVPSARASDAAPDDFGYSYVVLANETFECLFDEDDERFAVLFPAYFILALQAFDRVLDELKDSPETTRLSVSGDILEDIFDISGYALILDNFGVPGPWKTVRSIWNKYLAGEDDAKARLNLFATLATLAERSLAMTPRSLVHTNWHRRFGHRLAERGLAARGRHDLPDEHEPLAGGAIAQGFVRSSFHKGRHAFFAFYLGEHPDCQGVDLPLSATHFRKDVQRQQRRAAESMGGHD